MISMYLYDGFFMEKMIQINQISKKLFLQIARF
jgi:hypothetical protein